jgi:hypothetical protein
VETSTWGRLAPEARADLSTAERDVVVEMVERPIIRGQILAGQRWANSSEAMKKYWFALQAAALAFAIAFAVPAEAKDVMMSKTVAAYRVESHLLPAEPFYTTRKSRPNM